MIIQLKTLSVKCADCGELCGTLRTWANECKGCGLHFCLNCQTLKRVDGVLMCESCAKDYRIDHPDMEELIAAAEYREDR